VNIPLVRDMNCLADFGVPNVLANPTLELCDNNGTLLFANNDWQDDPIQASEIIAAGLAPAHELVWPSRNAASWRLYRAADGPELWHG
jgi:hypothetical protein